MNHDSQSDKQSLQSVSESVSALMDGEADALELRRVLKVEHQEVVDERWRSYHLVREALSDKGRSMDFQHWDISTQVSAIIAEQPTVSGGASGAGRWASWWLKPAAGFAVAASVAAAVVIGVQAPAGPAGAQAVAVTGAVPERVASVASSRVYPQAGTSLQASTASLPQVVERPVSQLPTAMGLPLNDSERNAQFDKYMLRHTQQAALNNGQGMISFARVANFDTE